MAHFELMASVPMRMYSWYTYASVLVQRIKLHSFEKGYPGLNFLGIGSSGRMQAKANIEVRIDLKKVHPQLISI